MSSEEEVVREFIRFSSVLNHEWTEKMRRLRGELGNEEFTYRALVVAYLFPAGVREHAIDEFIRQASLEKLLRIAQEGGDPAEFAVQVARLIRGFRPGRAGWAKFKEFIKRVVELALKKTAG